MPLFLQKGAVFRLANREQIVWGQWYITCRCKGCGKYIHVLPMPTPFFGRPFVGEGKISVPCRRCNHDDIYESGDFFVQMSDVDIPAAGPLRIEPSDMPRQPLLRTKYKDAKATFGPNALEDRPKASALIARIIGISSEIDAAFSLLMGRMLKANTGPSMALFLSLRQSRVQNEALNAVARIALDDNDQELFDALMSLRSGADNERDALAHGRFGESPAIADGVVWVDAFDLLQHTVRAEAEGLTDENQQWFRTRMYVYELGDLERIARHAEAIYNSVRSFAGYLLSDDAAWRGERYRQLCAEPHVQQTISQLREGAKKRDR